MNINQPLKISLNDKQERTAWKHHNKIAVKVFLSLAVSVLIFIAFFFGMPHVNNRMLIVTDQKGKTSIDKRVNLIKSNSKLPQLQLTLSNFGEISNKEQLDNVQKLEYERLNEIYLLQKITKELPFCVIIQGLDMGDTFSFEYTLNSVFLQNYTNYKAVIYSSSQQNRDAVSQYLISSNIKSDRYKNIFNQSSNSLINNIYEASRSYCHKESITLNMVGNNELIGKNVFKVFNAIYQANPVGLVYSNFYRYTSKEKVLKGYNYKYSSEMLQKIREAPFFLTSSVTYRTSHFLNITLNDLKDDLGVYLDSVYEQAIYYPLVELLCKKIIKIDEVFMLVKEATTFQDFIKSGIKVASRVVRQKKPYSCSKVMQSLVRSSVDIISHQKEYLLEIPQLISISDERVQAGGTKPKVANPKHFNSPPKKQLLKKLYPNEKLLAQRMKYEQRRLQIVNRWSNVDNNQLIKYNVYPGERIDPFQHNQEEQEYLSLQDKKNDEIPICIVVHEFATPDLFRTETMLNSLFSQNYTNFFAVLVNRNPQKDQFLRRYLHFHAINRERYVYLEDYGTKGPVQVVDQTIRKYCNKDAMAFVLDGRGEFLGKNNLKIFNAQLHDSTLIYSNGYNYDQIQERNEYMPVSIYDFDTKQRKTYREVGKHYSPLVFFKIQHFLSIKPEDLRNSNGAYLTSNLHELLYYPMLEMSCKFNSKIGGMSYILHVSSDVPPAPYDNDLREQIKTFKKYNCYDDVAVLSFTLPVLSSTLTPELQAISQNRVQTGGTKADKKDGQQLNLAIVKEGKTIAAYLYGGSDKLIKARKDYQLKRERSLKNAEENQPLLQFNLKIPRDNSEQAALLATENKINKDESVQQNFQELPICVVVDHLSFQLPFRFQYTLNSVFLQNYTNYFVVIFGDGSSTGDLLIRKYLYFYGIPKERFVYLENSEKKQGLQNIYLAVHKYCSADSIVTYLPGEDELVGKNPLKALNRARQKQSLLAYSNYYIFGQEEQRIQYGSTSQYLEQEISENKFRQVESRFNNFLGFNAGLFKMIKLEDLKDGEQFYREAWMRAMVVPMLEMACKRISKMPGVHYAHVQTGRRFDSERLSSQRQKINLSKPYSCNQTAVKQLK